MASETSTISNKANLEWARDAFVEAHGRFSDSLQQSKKQDVWTTLGETLFWISALNDTYVGMAEAHAEQAARAKRQQSEAPNGKNTEDKAARDKGRKTFIGYRDADGHGRSVAGLTIPRNSLVHALGNIVIERPEDADITWQPTFVSLEHMNLDRRQGATAKNVLLESAERPIRYQLRDANYFFIRRQKELDDFMEKTAWSDLF